MKKIQTTFSHMWQKSLEMCPSDYAFLDERKKNPA